MDQAGIGLMASQQVIQSLQQGSGPLQGSAAAGQGLELGR